jgi:hypothetical protein
MARLVSRIALVATISYTALMQVRSSRRTTMNMHAIWRLFFRGILYGFLGGFALIVLLFFLSSKRDGHLMYAHLVANPIEFLYFLLGMEIGIALIGLLVFYGFHSLHESARRFAESGWKQPEPDK